MTEVPYDPLRGTTFSWVGNNTVSDYGYVVAKRNSVTSGWFALMAKTEVAWWSNWVVCSGPQTITGWTDLGKIHPCSSVVEVDDESKCANPNSTWSNSVCSWTLWQMRYILLY